MSNHPTIYYRCAKLLIIQSCLLRKEGCCLTYKSVHDSQWPSEYFKQWYKNAHVQYIMLWPHGIPTFPKWIFLLLLCLMAQIVERKKQRSKKYFAVTLLPCTQLCRYMSKHILFWSKTRLQDILAVSYCISGNCLLRPHCKWIFLHKYFSGFIFEESLWPLQCMPHRQELPLVC